VNRDVAAPAEPGVLKVGLIGAGKMGINHLKAITACTGVRIAGIADPHADEEKLRPIVGPDVPILSRVEDLFSQVRPDVVHIVTPPKTHTAIARMALEAGSHIYVEKPFTLESAETTAILKLAAERNLKVCAGHQCLYQRSASLARSRLAEIGTPVHIESYFSFHTVRRSISPVDQAKDILPHAVYMLVDFMRAARPNGGQIEIRGLDASADGGIYAVLALDDCRGILAVTLKGRPKEQYLHVVGTNGSMRVDLVSDSVIELRGPGISSVSAIVNPYRQMCQTLTRVTAGFYRRIRDRKQGYAGHRQLCQSFYDSIRTASPLPTTPQAILDTVAICEDIGRVLDEANERAEKAAQAELARLESAMPAVSAGRGAVLVTGAGGFLGRAVLRELRDCNWEVRALTRSPLRYTARLPGIDYYSCDIASGIPADLMRGVSAVVHCAAETKGGKAEHERNSIKATEEVLKAMQAAGVKRLVHVSSVAVMSPPSGSRPMDEKTSVDFDDLSRGPYAWGKAQSERVVLAAKAQGVEATILRLGPLVEFSSFDPPGRLGREAGQVYVAVGPRNSRLALCDVATAASVIRAYVQDFSIAPPVLNLLEPEAPTRRDLIGMLRQRRRDLSVIWIPMWFMKLISPPLKLVQRLALGSKQPLDISSAFANLRYDTGLAAEIIGKARAGRGNCGGT
jgi:predicted dehydrogenase/nucleoside-diphosphate-sugar epimerase